MIAEETPGVYTRTLSYDSDGNVSQMHQVDHAQRVTVTLSYGWEPGTHRLTTFTRTVNSNVTYKATLEYDRLNRIRRFCSSAVGCSDLTYVGESNWLATIRDASGVVRQRYVYANGRPLRVDINGTPYYYRYDWHGNVAGRVAANGDGASIWQSYGAWGDLGNGFGEQYYNWNGAWGYMRFPNPFNFDLHDHLDQGLYYIHGRWYNQDTGLFLSPDENGSYKYNEQQDAINYAWRIPQLCLTHSPAELSDCEKFVDEVRRFISLAQAQGASDSLTVQLLAHYYAGIRSTWQVGPFTVWALGGVFHEHEYFQDPTPRFTIGDRWRVTDPAVYQFTPEGEQARRKYGFKRIFYTNTHHYFADFYLAWFWGGWIAGIYNEEFEKWQYRNAPTDRKRDVYFDSLADIVVADVAIRHARIIKQLAGLGKYGAVVGERSVLPGKAIQELPRLLLQDLCATTDNEIFQDWPPVRAIQILGPEPRP